MTTLRETLGWLNQFDFSHLNDDSRAWLDALQRASVPDQEVRRQIALLLERSRNSGDRLDYPEALLGAGVIEFSRGWVAEAETHFFQAYTFYHPRNHHRAVAAWLLGFAEWLTRQNESAYSHWQEAFTIFTEVLLRVQVQLDQAGRIVDPATRQQEEALFQVRRNWYSEKVEWMDTDLSTKPEEAYTWLHLGMFDPVPLSVSSEEIHDIFREKVAADLYPSAYELLREVRRHGIFYGNPQETPEVYIECGMAAYRMGNNPVAAELVEMAVARFHPESHFQVMARWMLGAIQWQIPQQVSRARRSWQVCIEDAQRLETRADRDARANRRDWYRWRRHIMELALAMRVRRAYAERGDFDYLQAL